MELPSMNGRFYPLPMRKHQLHAKKYFDLFPDWTYSIGRAGTYRYEVDIDDCIWQAMQIEKQVLEKNYSGPIVGDKYKIK